MKTKELRNLSYEKAHILSIFPVYEILLQRWIFNPQKTGSINFLFSSTLVNRTIRFQYEISDPPPAPP